MLIETLNGHNVRFDGRTLAIRIPMRFRRRGGRKVIITPEGAACWAPHAPRLDSTLIRALARAHRWKRLLEDGVYTSLAELSERETINPSYVSRILRLSLLAPEIVEAILDGRQARSLQLADLMKPFSMEWEKQKSLLRLASP